MNNFDTTYYLCALAHLDQNFRDKVINEFIDEEYKALGISYGINVIPIIKHCIQANRSQIQSDIFLTLVLFFVFIFFEQQNLFLLALLLITTWIIVFSKLWCSYSYINKISLSNNYGLEYLNNSQNNDQLNKKLNIALNSQNANIIIYNKFIPFVGFGYERKRWSFAIDISKGKNDINSQSPPSSFDIKDLYSFVDEQVNELNIKNLVIKDRVVVDGQSINLFGFLLPNPFERPTSNLGDQVIKSYISNINENIRFYKCFHISLWNGALVLSSFLRFTKVKQNLYVEYNSYLLPPLKKEYYKKVDSIRHLPRSQKFSEVASTTTFRFLFLLIISPLVFLSKIFLLFPTEEKLRKRKLIQRKLFNYGANTTLREQFSASKYRRYFQLLDQDMYNKIIERRIIDVITEFLDKKGIDTSDLKDRTNAILNNGVIVSGGSVNAENLTVGQQAKSTMINNK